MATLEAGTFATRPAATQKRKTPWRNLVIGACMNITQVTTLGQPLEVLKTHAGANRNDSLADAVRKTYARAGFRGFYQGLIPWAWLEASTKGAILILTSTEVEHYAKTYLNAGNSMAGALGGIVGGASQAYLTMGVTTCMKTVEVTRTKSAQAGVKVPGTMQTFFDILRTKGIRGINRGVNAVALRQITGWSSRIGISRFAEGNIKSLRGKSEADKLTFGEKMCASTLGGALSCWNQPFEVLRIEMQSLKADAARPEALTMASTARHIWRTSGPTGFFRGVVPRIGVAAWATVCMVGFGDIVKEAVSARLDRG
ncbi:hypothetical protein ACJ41O_010908 [Fusarium nematophilum]